MNTQLTINQFRNSFNNYKLSVHRQLNTHNKKLEGAIAIYLVAVECNYQEDAINKLEDRVNRARGKVLRLEELNDLVRDFSVEFSKQVHFIHHLSSVQDFLKEDSKFLHSIVEQFGLTGDIGIPFLVDINCTQDLASMGSNPLVCSDSLKRWPSFIKHALEVSKTKAGLDYFYFGEDCDLELKNNLESALSYL